VVYNTQISGLTRGFNYARGLSVSARIGPRFPARKRLAISRDSKIATVQREGRRRNEEVRRDEPRAFAQRDTRQRSLPLAIRIDATWEDRYRMDNKVESN